MNEEKKNMEENFDDDEWITAGPTEEQRLRDERHRKDLAYWKAMAILSGCSIAFGLAGIILVIIAHFL